MPSNGTLIGWLIGALSSLAIFIIGILAWAVKKHLDDDETFKRDIIERVNRAVEDIAALKALNHRNNNH